MDTSPTLSSMTSQSLEVSSTHHQTKEPKAPLRTEATQESSQAYQSEQEKSDLVQHLLKDNEYMNVEFDDDTKRVVFQSIDRTSGKVINQFPSEEMLSLVAHFRQTVGVFSDQEV